MSNFSEKQNPFLIIDSREKDYVQSAFYNQLQGFDEPKVQECSIGDFWICTKDEKGEILPLVIFERKTWDDYLGSLESNRLDEQRKRLLESEHRIVFIIEGERTPLVGFKKRDRFNTEAFLDYSQLRDNISVFYSESINETVRRVQRIMEKLRDKTFFDKMGSGKSFAECMKLKKKTGLTHQECYISQLAQVPNVTIPLAREIAKIYPNNIVLCRKIHKHRDNVIITISNITHTSNRRFGEVRACAFVQYMSGEIKENDNLVKQNKKRKRI